MRGYASLHPMQAALLEELGIESDAVSQGWGSAAASAGFHAPCGTAGGKKYSDCFDLRWDALDKTLRDKLVAASVCVFPRDWPGNRHHHCVSVGLEDDKGRCRILAGPRTQVRDFFNGRSGLAGHGPWVGKWKPTDGEQHEVYMSYQGWVPDIATEVQVDGHTVGCYAWMEQKKTVFSEVRPLVTALGARIIDAWTAGLTVRDAAGAVRRIVLPDAYIAGEFMRAPVRDIAEALGYTVGFDWCSGYASAVVHLTGGKP